MFVFLYSQVLHATHFHRFCTFFPRIHATRSYSLFLVYPTDLCSDFIFTRFTEITVLSWHYRTFSDFVIFAIWLFALCFPQNFH